jgi:uncharacterized protein YbjT (DUF2867 family)
MNQILKAAFDSAARHTGDRGAALVTGATGFLGGQILTRLLAAGRTVTVVSRTPQPALAARGIRIVTGSLTDSATCAEAVV